MFKVIGTDTFLNEVSKWEKTGREAVKKLPPQLAQRPLTGKPLNYKFLREKKIKEKRVYYLVYEDLQLVLLVATSGKKDQQATINHIKRNLDEFRKVAENLSKQAF